MSFCCGKSLKIKYVSCYYSYYINNYPKISKQWKLFKNGGFWKDVKTQELSCCMAQPHLMSGCQGLSSVSTSEPVSNNQNKDNNSTHT